MCCPMFTSNCYSELINHHKTQSRWTKLHPSSPAQLVTNLIISIILTSAQQQPVSTTTNNLSKLAQNPFKSISFILMYWIWLIKSRTASKYFQFFQWSPVLSWCVPIIVTGMVWLWCPNAIFRYVGHLLQLLYWCQVLNWIHKSQFRAGATQQY